MLKLMQSKRRNNRRRLSVRAWLAIWLQHRRRKRVSPVPNAPVVTGSSWLWDATTPGLVDITVNFTFDRGSFPVAYIEVWFKRVGTSPEVLVGTIASTETSFTHTEATDDEDFVFYTLRYVNDDVLGPFSERLSVNAWHIPNTPQGFDGSTDEGGATYLTWNMDNVSYEDGVSIEGRKDADPFVERATTGPGMDSATLGVPAGSWEFRIRTFNGHGFSEYTGSVFVTVT